MNYCTATTWLSTRHNNNFHEKKLYKLCKTMNTQETITSKDFC